ncbi:MAG: carbon-nitrogen hydrolase family protein [Clostridia bacterium]|nr:carbon-nitrogen hydrolase family protein [Clostridia bacterium]
MRIGLAAYRCENKNTGFNISQIERALKETQGRVDLICFGEAFVQGFDSLTWDHDVDIDNAVDADSPEFGRLRELSVKYDTAILTGYYERAGDRIYSSCAVISKGGLIANYRRVSRGWKELEVTDERYSEGTDAPGFDLNGVHFSLGLCGDLWDEPGLFKTDGLLIWPVFLSFETADWDEWALAEYAEHAASLCRAALVVNPIDPETGTHGAAFLFGEGCVKRRLPFDEEGTLIIDIDRLPS